jgi:hypothetical protein
MACPLRWSSVDSRPKRKYTVSEKVLAANRRNLVRANAVPKDFRYRGTVRRQQASRENLRKALAARKPPPPPRHGTFNCQSVWKRLRGWGRVARHSMKSQRKRLVQLLQLRNETEARLAEAIAQAFVRWTGPLRDRARGERKGLLRILKGRPRNARSAIRLVCRLVGLFEDEAWMQKAFDQLGLRLERLGRMFWENRHIPNKVLTAALQEASAEELGNPFQPVKSSRMEEILLRPAQKMMAHASQPPVQVEELPGEKHWETVAGVSPPSQSTKQQQDENEPSLFPLREKACPEPVRSSSNSL